MNIIWYKTYCINIEINIFKKFQLIKKKQLNFNFKEN
jgi:hypothetical protein